MEKSIFRSILKEYSCVIMSRNRRQGKGGESMPFINAHGSYADDAL